MKKGYLYIMLAALLFSTMEIVLKLVSNEFNPIQITFLRFLIGSILLLPLALKNLKVRNISLTKKDLIFFSFTGFVCVVVSMVLYQMSILYAKASIIAILFSCNPVFVVLLANIILKEKLYKQTIISMVISLLGMVFIMNPLKMSLTATALVLVLLSAVTFAYYGVICKEKSAKFGGVVLSCFSFLMGSLEMLVLILITKISAVATFLTNSGFKTFADIPVIKGITLQNIPMLIYISIFVTGLGYTFYFLAMEETSATTASVVFFIKPALAPILALIILREAIALNTLAGIVLIIIGSIINFKANKEQKEEIPELDEDTVNG